MNAEKDTKHPQPDPSDAKNIQEEIINKYKILDEKCTEVLRKIRKKRLTLT
jgi:hypothetical protein